ncbi:hypothetical protein H5410_064001 [Solanum commersonii]|uniref:Uncharacterized protein n=1 Tax=Solanum commersonii TaxID=4109 RepID=A0A9J5W0G1_SOLCO|nr:hypothetical protein H5410_064001 [Solanum commersonii]
MHLLDKRSTRALPVAAMIHDNSTDRTAIVPATHHSNFCPINFRWIHWRASLVPAAADFGPITLAFGIGVMINRDKSGHSDFIVEDSAAPYEKSKFWVPGSMVARLKLKGIDGRAPPGVEPAA